MASISKDNKKSWSLMDSEYQDNVKYQSECGNYICCKICFDWSPDNDAMGKKQGLIKMRGPFQIYNFKQHVKSSKVHKRSLNEKARVEDEEAAKRGEKRKRKLQTVLNFVKKKPKMTTEIASGIRAPDDGTNEGSKNSDTVTTTPPRLTFKVPVQELMHAHSRICRGMMSNNDLKDKNFQEAMELCVKYCISDDTIMASDRKFIPKLIDSNSNKYSFFSKTCENKNVR